MRVIYITIFLFIVHQGVWGQEEEKNPPKEYKDPTEFSPSLKKALEAPKKNEVPIPTTAEKSVIVEVKEATIPVIRLKAKMILKDRPGLAMIEVDQQLLIVTDGDTFTLPPKKENEKPFIFHIKEVSLNKVELTFDGHTEGIILR